MSSPEKTTEPLVGRRKPLNRLKQVVLPAPFGPISPTISPVSTVRSRLLTAASPPKCLERLRASSSGIRQPTGLGVGVGAVRHHLRPPSFAGNVMSPPGRNKIVSSIAIEKNIVSYALPRNGSDSKDRKIAPTIGPAKCPRPPTKLYTRMFVAIRKPNSGGKRKRTKWA